MNRLNSDTSFRIRQTLDVITSGVSTFQQQMSSGFETQLAAAVAEARGKVPAHRSVSDEDLRRDVRLEVRRAWLEQLQATHRDLKVKAERANELLVQSRQDARVLRLPSAPAGASNDQRIIFGLDLLNLRLEFPRETPLSELWDAFSAANASGDTMRAGYLENLVESQLERPLEAARDPHEAARMKRERDTIRQQLETIRDGRPTENDRGNLDAWERELNALQAHLSSARQALMIHARTT